MVSFNAGTQTRHAALVHSSDRQVSDSGVWARESIGGPTSTVTVPGRLRKALRPQNRPACARPGRPTRRISTASHAPPSSILAVFAGLTRVPSGKIGSRTLARAVRARARPSIQRPDAAAAVDGDRAR